ncbi:MAG: type II toxin-antitoxin system RelE/ParE family toxin [Eggerthellaceae bacterium]|nr:type II toxin-antitoxin system RelE/ParE family toxin [Eggerthellaceae bacterium]
MNLGNYRLTKTRKRNQLSSPRLRDHVDAMLRTIELMPGVGSSLVEPSLKSRYGNNIYKALVGPYLIVYEYDREQDTVLVYDLISCWAVH